MATSFQDGGAPSLVYKCNCTGSTFPVGGPKVDCRGDGRRVAERAVRVVRRKQYTPTRAVRGPEEPTAKLSKKEFGL